MKIDYGANSYIYIFFIYDLGGGCCSCATYQLAKHKDVVFHKTFCDISRRQVK
jgi:hypothetical protein